MTDEIFEAMTSDGHWVETDPRIIRDALDRVVQNFITPTKRGKPIASDLKASRLRALAAMDAVITTLVRLVVSLEKDPKQRLLVVDTIHRGMRHRIDEVNRHV